MHWKWRVSVTHTPKDDPNSSKIPPPGAEQRPGIKPLRSPLLILVQKLQSELPGEAAAESWISKISPSFDFYTPPSVFLFL